MPSGSGPSLGAALMAFLKSYAPGGPGGGRSYTATGWHAQISKLTSSPRGSRAADAVGLDPAPRTVQRWLAQEQTPGPANMAKIAAAYALMGGAFPKVVQDMTIKISGRVKIGPKDERDRGSGRNAPLRVDHSNGDWSAIEEAWEDGELDADYLEELYVEYVVDEDISDLSGGVSFPGGGYTVAS